MAPIAKAKILPEGFVLVQTPEGEKVRCTLCSAVAPATKDFAWTSLPAHLKSKAHARAIEHNEDTRTRAAVIERNREKDLAERREAEARFSALRDVHILPQPTQARIQSAAESELWDELAEDPQAAGFDFGIDRTTQQYNELCGEMNSLWNAGIMAHDTGFALGEEKEADLLQDDDEDDFLAKLCRMLVRCYGRPSRNGPVTLRYLALDSDPEGGDILNFESQDPQNPSLEWSPYPSKMLFLLDTLDNLPRLRISNSLMKVFLWILKESGSRDVPSFDHLRKVQTKLREKCGIPTTQYMSAKGNIFHMNDPRTLVAKDWANPETRKHIHIYPEIPEDGVIREIWHAQKWRKDLDLDVLSPMYDARNLHAHFYVNELARLSSGDFVIPIRWLTFRGRVWADAFTVKIDTSGVATVIDTHTTLISSADLVANYLDLEDEGSIPQWSAKTLECGHSERMPNPKRALAGGDPLYHCRVDYFGDDVSGNRSKSWNKHWNAYMTNRNLPRALLNQEFHVHFISTSPHASITEQFIAFKSVSEITGHIGAKGNFFCRKCEAGGSEKDKETNECFHSLFEPGTPRSKEKILTELKKQVKLACSGVAQPIKNTQKDTGVKDAYTQHWIDHLLEQFKLKKEEKPGRTTAEIQEELIQWTLDNEDKIYSGFLTMKGFDPTKDTPVEILHTILLGVVKYIWHSSYTSWNTAQKQTYSLRLQATNTDGLSVHAIRANYIMQYANSLSGRQFKTIAQVNVFHVHGIVTPEQFTTWRAVGEFSALIWVPEIRNLDEYLHDIDIAAGNVMDTFAIVDPTKILSKIKLHLLTHSRDDIRSFGPLVGVMTEIFECFNAVFRFCSILSNHLAPSRDIALQLADQEGLKHRLTGGWWPTVEGEGDWERAGTGVRTFLETRPVLQRLVGWTIHTPPTPGSVKLIPLPKRQKGVPRPTRSALMLRSTRASQAQNVGKYDMASSWFACRQVISASLDECKTGSWVFAKSPITIRTSTHILIKDELITGRINNILEDGHGSAIIVLDVFHVSDEHSIFGMPVLARRQSEETSLLFLPCELTRSQDIKFLYNVQHDCNLAECKATGKRPRMQERVDSGITDKFIVHNPMERFIINMHAFHNAHLLRQALPCRLTIPIPLFADRQAKHYELGASLREIKDGKYTEEAGPKILLVTIQKKKLALGEGPCTTGRVELPEVGAPPRQPGRNLGVP
ncbi:hypothetical protein B0H17DRAFT_1149590 [Mycena rosella]|uniref:Uncharacterized protein n=1 Tax=Mycena rosella TaxID=1033263 RepID=A0AAD7C0M7_MYCRO|nr:hypothetical protein B0H17DRAFT_1149590 [Mycena rosella]